MRKIPELSIFIKHFDWWKKDKNDYYVPTEKAPPEAIKAMEKVNALIKHDEKHSCNRV
ncbi:MAG: hypothetical protein IJ903_05950 [Ruminococcus sp.]|nr:hypothetical protein [Ruminococcus sp.]